MDREPLISIVMPVYNCERYIMQAVESVIAQTYQNWELLIINDASQDNTQSIVNELAQKDSRIHVYDNAENSGVSKTRNRGVTLAKGDWIAFLDSDDAWAVEKLEKQVNFLQTNEEAELIFTGSAFINEDNQRAGYELHVPQTVDFRELLKQNVISCSSVLIKKEYLLLYSMPGDKMHEDYTVWLRTLKKVQFAYGIDEPLLIYRISSNSKSGNKLNAAKMQYRVYRFVGLNIFQAMHYMVWYTVRNLRKYRKIYSSI